MSEIKMNMIYFKDALQLDDINKIEDQIIVRRKLITEMVGQLYPDIVRGEIYNLNQRIRELQD